MIDTFIQYASEVGRLLEGSQVIMGTLKVFGYAILTYLAVAILFMIVYWVDNMREFRPAKAPRKKGY